jgi:hypothetical protein
MILESYRRGVLRPGVSPRHGVTPIGLGVGPPHWSEVLLSVVQQLVRDWHLKRLKNGHRERVKDRVININKQG